MKRRFYSIANRLGATITSYHTYREVGMGGLQVFHIEYTIGDKHRSFDDSYFHLSGDEHKVLEMFEIEINKSLTKTPQ